MGTGKRTLVGSKTRAQHKKRVRILNLASLVEQLETRVRQGRKLICPWFLFDIAVTDISASTDTDEHACRRVRFLTAALVL